MGNLCNWLWMDFDFFLSWPTWPYVRLVGWRFNVHSVGLAEAYRPIHWYQEGIHQQFNIILYLRLQKMIGNAYDISVTPSFEHWKLCRNAHRFILLIIFEKARVSSRDSKSMAANSNSQSQCQKMFTDLSSRRVMNHIWAQCEVRHL